MAELALDNNHPHKNVNVEIDSKHSPLINNMQQKRNNHGKWEGNIIHLLTGNEDSNTCIVPKVPTIVRNNAEDNSWYRGDNKGGITPISSL